jgi:hypothetical protein
MDVFVYVASAFFVLFALGIVFAWTRQRHFGLLLIAGCYGAAAGAAIALMEAWPLLAGFAAAWAVRLMGLDPDAPRK